MAQKLTVLTINDFDRIRSDLARVFHVNQVQTSGFVLVSYTGPTTLSLVKSFPNGTAADLIRLLDDSQVQYALVRLPQKDDQPYKDIFLQWIGCNVSKIERGKKSEHLADAKTLLSPSHIDLTALTRVGFTDEKLRALSDPSAGSHVLKPSDDATERQNNQATLQADAAVRKQSEEKHHAQAEEKKKQFSGAPSPRGLGDPNAVHKLSVISIQDAPLIAKSVAGLLDRAVSRGWVLVRYVGGTSIALQATGIESPIEGLLTHLEDNQIQYALVRLPPASSLETPKDIFLSWIGPKVSKMEQAKKTEHLQDLKQVLSPSHATLTAMTKIGFTEHKLKELADPAAGSHVLKAPDA